MGRCAAFAGRFTEFVGEPPLSYLTRWRMSLAAKHLKTSDDALDRIAGAVGYESATAFGNAFRRHIAASPGRYQDRGVDLVANAPGERVFVQCKFTLQSMGAKKVEELLYAASVFVSENLSRGANYFDLVVPSLAFAFPAKRGRRNASARHAFIRHNGLQNKVKLRLREVSIELPEQFDFPKATGLSDA